MNDFELFETLIFIGQTITQFINELWTWFINPQTIGDYTITPIEALPVIGITLLGLWIVKTFIPVA